MSDLDKKLYNLLKEVDSEDRFDDNFINLQVLSVKKLFIDEGWTDSVAVFQFKEDSQGGYVEYVDKNGVKMSGMIYDAFTHPNLNTDLGIE